MPCLTTPNARAHWPVGPRAARWAPRHMARYRLRTAMLAYVWPRLDVPVTKSVNPLIKSPWVAHPKTGRIAIPLDPNDYWRFDPRTAPTISNLGADWERNTKDITKWIAHDPPQLPEYRRKRRSKPRAESDVPDVEDLANN
mgnify:CR=1 FL=1